MEKQRKMKCFDTKRVTWDIKAILDSCMKWNNRKKYKLLKDGLNNTPKFRKIFAFLTHQQLASKNKICHKCVRDHFTWCIKVKLSPSKKISFYLLQWKPFKMMKNAFLYHLEGSFCYIFKFLSCIFVMWK